MSASNDDPAASYNASTLVSINDSRVWITTGVRKMFDQFDERSRERLIRVMEYWCMDKKLPTASMNRNEGRSKLNEMVMAFKAFQRRLYGFERTIDGIRTFVIVDCDPAKKQNKADPKILNRTKGRVDTFGKEK